jgi:diadenosine tetraphosphatase ApaH/serine/threonine PP2A family protein phosphatase
VLADLESKGGANYLINLGDMAVFGPDPAGVLATLQSCESIIQIRGNTDRYLIEKQYPGTPDGNDWQSQVLASFPWTAEQLGQSGIDYLARLPVQRRLEFGPEHTVLAVHGSVRSDEENIKPETPLDELEKMTQADAPYNLLLCAHTHVTVDRWVNNRRVLNVGSVGLPFDGDPRASYAFIQLLPGGHYQVQLRRVEYDVEAVIKQLQAVNHPTMDVGIYNLRNARPLGQKLVYTNKMRRGLSGDGGQQLHSLLTPPNLATIISG